MGGILGSSVLFLSLVLILSLCRWVLLLWISEDSSVCRVGVYVRGHCVGREKEEWLTQLCDMATFERAFPRADEQLPRASHLVRFT